MPQPCIAIAANGDPADPHTWSGTSANIVRALDLLGVKVVGIDAMAISKFERLLYFVVYQIWRIALSPTLSLKRQMQLMRSFERSDYNLMAIVRNRRARRVERKMRALNVTAVLHMQYHALPAGRHSVQDIRHSLVLDSTAWTEYTQQQALHPDRRPASINWSFQQCERNMFANAAHLFPVAQYLKNDLLDFYEIPARKVTFIGTGLGGVKPFYGEKNYVDGPILFVARTRFEEKGGVLLIQAFQRAYAVNPALKLVMVVSEENRRLYGSLPGVTAYGLLPFEQLQQIFNASALLAMPAPAEPYGLVLQEALAVKTPILGLNRNAVPEFCGKGRYGFLVAGPDPQLLADALLSAMSDSLRLKLMGEAGQRHILDNYSWEKTARRICSGLGIVPIDKGQPVLAGEVLPGNRALSGATR